MLNGELEQTRLLLEQATENSQQLENQLSKFQTQNFNTSNELQQHKQDLQVAIKTKNQLKDQNQILLQDNQRLLQAMKRQEQRQAEQVSKSTTSELTGNWKLRVNVESIVSTTSTRPSNRIVEYDVWIDVRHGKVQGAIHGVKDVSKMVSDSPSKGNGAITGSYSNDGELVFYVGKSSIGPVSRYRLRFKEGQLFGRLEVESLVSGWQVYEGSVVGSRTNSL